MEFWKVSGMACGPRASEMSPKPWGKDSASLVSIRERARLPLKRSLSFPSSMLESVGRLTLTWGEHTYTPEKGLKIAKLAPYTCPCLFSQCFRTVGTISFTNTKHHGNCESMWLKTKQSCIAKHLKVSHDTFYWKYSFHTLGRQNDGPTQGQPGLTLLQPRPCIL